MKKIFLFATAVLLISGAAFANEGGKDKKKTETKDCAQKDMKDCKMDMKDCKKEGKSCCSKDAASKSTKPAPAKAKA